MLDFNLLAGILGVCLSAATFFIGRISGAKTDGREMGEIKTLLNCTKDTVERLEKNLESSFYNLSIKVDVLEKDVAIIGESMRNAHKRIDELGLKRR